MSNVATYLASTNVLSRVPRSAVVGSVPLWSLQNLEDGQVFCKEGDPGDSIAVLVEGECTAQVDGVEVGRIKRGDLIGESSVFFIGGTRSATVVSRARSSFLLLRGEDLRRLRAEQSPVYMALVDHGLHELARRVQRANDRLTRLVEGTHERPARKDPSALVRLWKSLVPGKPAAPCPSLEPLLRRLPGLAKAPPGALAPLRDAFESRAFAEGEVLFLEQDSADAAWVVALGKVDVLRQVRGTRAERLTTLSAGDLFAVNALIAKGPRTASCVATTPVWAFRISAEASGGLKGEALLWWSECVLAVMQEQLRRANGNLGRAAGSQADSLLPPAPTASEPQPDAVLQGLLTQSGFLEGLPLDFNLDDVEVVIDEDTLRNSKRRH